MSDSPKSTLGANWMDDLRMPQLRRLEVGEVVEATIVAIGESNIFLSVGAKSEAALERIEVTDEEGQLTVAEGDKMKVFIQELEPELRVSISLARGHVNREAIEDARDLGIPVEGKVTGVNKGGLEVSLGGARAFCPVSHIEAGFCADPEVYVGQTLAFQVVEVKDDGKDIVVSRRRLLEQERKERAAETEAMLQEGAEFNGEVMRIEPFGAFVDIGGIEGLVHVGEISHQRVENPSDILTVGQSVRVLVKSISADPKRPGQRRIGLSMRAFEADPWDSVESVVSIGATIEGKVVRIKPFGAFVSIGKGIDGLVHISEMADRRINDPSEVVEVGQTVTVTVLEIDRARQRIGLSLLAQPAPGEAGVRLVEGEIVKAIVDSVKPFGVFVRIQGAPRKTRGLIPVQDTGAAEGANLRRIFPAGKELDAIIASVEPETGRLRLSVTALAEAAGRADYEAYARSAQPQRAPSSTAGAKSSGAGGLGTLGDLLAASLDKKKAK